jgi:hypothetical protein
MGNKSSESDVVLYDESIQNVLNTVEPPRQPSECKKILLKWHYEKSKPRVYLVAETQKLVEKFGYDKLFPRCTGCGDRVTDMPYSVCGFSSGI